MPKDFLDFVLVPTNDVMAGTTDHDTVAFESGYKSNVLLG